MLKALICLCQVLIPDMLFVTDPRAQTEDPVEKDRLCARHSLAWDLVQRALRWTRALQARLAAEARAKKTGRSAEAEGLDRLARRMGRPDWYKPASKPRKRAPDIGIGPRANDCILGLTTAEVAAHICADLAHGVTLLGNSKALGIVVAIAKDVREMLGGSDELWQPRPVWPAADRGAGPAMRAAPAMGPRAPDTG